MPNAIFFRHLVLFLPHRRLPPALACSRRSTPLSSLAIAVRGSRRKPTQSSLPFRCLRRLLSLSLIAVVSCQQPQSFQFIVRRRRRRCFLSAVDIITIYCPPSPCLLLPAPSLISCRASSLPPSPAITLTSDEIGQRRMGGGVRLMVRRNRWTVVAAAAMGISGHCNRRRQHRWHNRGGRRQRRWWRNGSNHDAQHRDRGGRWRRQWATAAQWAAGR